MTDSTNGFALEIGDAYPFETPNPYPHLYKNWKKLRKRLEVTFIAFFMRNHLEKKPSKSDQK